MIEVDHRFNRAARRRSVANRAKEHSSSITSEHSWAIDFGEFFQEEACLRVLAADTVPRSRSLMDAGRRKTLHYKRSHFATQLPIDYLYTPSHCWIAPQAEGEWRIGLTKFATRMLGEMVDHGFETELDASVQAGQIVGWVEGFKAISDLYCVADGKFGGGNPALKEKISLIDKDPYGAGWLYVVKGTPDSRCVDVEDYRKLLDKAIDKILERQKGEEIK